MLNWTSGNENSSFQVGMKYIIDPVSSVKVCMEFLGKMHCHKIKTGTKDIIFIEIKAKKNIYN